MTYICACRSLVLKSCPGYAQTEVQLRPQPNGSMTVRHDKLCQPAHKAMCLAFALQAMSQKHMHSAAASSLQKPISVHDASSLQSSTELAVAVVGKTCCITDEHLLRTTIARLDR